MLKTCTSSVLGSNADSLFLLYTETTESASRSDRICEPSVRSSCPIDASQCRYLHSQLPYQWQVVVYEHFVYVQYFTKISLIFWSLGM